MIRSVSCSCCKNKRLFDLESGAAGFIQIKCPVCRNVVEADLHTGKTKSIKAEQIGV